MKNLTTIGLTALKKPKSYFTPNNLSISSGETINLLNIKELSLDYSYN